MAAIYESRAFNLFVKDQQVYIQVKELGVTVYQFNDVLKKYPQVKVMSFGELQSALKHGTPSPVQIGCLKERLELEVSQDEMSAFIRVNLTEREIAEHNDQIVAEIVGLLTSNGITVGVNTDILKNELIAGRKILIAEGVKPVAGDDAVCRYYQISARKPKLNDTGTADHYELDLIDNVNRGD